MGILDSHDVRWSSASQSMRAMKLVSKSINLAVIVDKSLTDNDASVAVNYEHCKLES